MKPARCRSVRAARPAEHQPGAQQDQRGRQQPGDLATVVGVEHPGPTRFAPHAAVAPAATADAADLFAGDPAQAVVAEGELEDAIGLRAAYVWPRRCRHELDDRHPPSSADEHGESGDEQLPDPSPQSRRRGDQIRERERGHDEQRLQHLCQESEAHQQADQRQPPSARGFDGAYAGVPGEHEQQHEQRVGIVEAKHEHGHWRQRHDRAGEQARAEPYHRRTVV